MKWVGIIAGLAVSALIAAVVLAPRLIDWQSYKPEIARLAEEALGQPVRIDGNIRAELFPTPQLTAGNIRVLGGDGGPDLAKVRWTEARFKFSDLLRGEVTLTSLALVEPDFQLSSGLLERLQPTREDDAASPGTSASIGGSERRDVRRVEIRNGRFRVDLPGGGVFLAERVSGAVETPSVGRRIALDLSARIGERDFSIDMRVTPPSKDRAAPLSAVFTDIGNGARLRMVGDWSSAVQGHRFEGEFSVEGPSLAAVSALAGGGAPPAGWELGAVRLDGKLGYSAGESTLSLNSLSINTDVMSATGQASAQFDERPNLDLTLRVGRFDLDAFSIVNEATGVAGVPQQTSENQTAGAGIPAVGESVNLMDWAGTLPVDLSVDLSVAGARLRNTVVRRITVRGTVERGTVTLEELSAQLPGGTDLSVAGFGDLTGDEPLLEGNATLRADDLRRLLDWAGVDVPNISADRLRRFSMVSGISLGPRRLDIIDAAVELDGVTASAAAAVALRRRVGVGLRVALDHINLDAYRPMSMPIQTGAEAPAAKAGLAAPDAEGAGNPGSDVSGPWSKFDASLDLTVGRVVAFGVPFNDVVGDLVLKDGVLTVNQATFRDAAGLSGQIAGQVATDGDPETMLFVFDGESEDIGQFSALLEGPDFLSSMLRSMGRTAVKASYQPASNGAPFVFNLDGTDGGLSVAAALSENEEGEMSVDVLSGEADIQDMVLRGLTARLTFPPGVFQVEKLTGTLNGGTLNMSGNLRRREDGLRQLLITGALDDLRVDRPIADLDGTIGLRGTLSVRGQVEATGSDWRAMDALNNGWFDLDGSLAIAVGDSRSTIFKVRQVDEVRATLREHFADAGSFQGGLELENGTVTVRELTLSGKEGAALDVAGRLDLDDLDLSAEAVLSKGKAAPKFARLIAEGPINAPNLRLEGAGPSID